MKTKTYQTKEEWLLDRRGRITGSRAKDIINKRGTGKKIGFYELIAEKIAIASDGENPMDRGTRLEPEALERFMKETGEKIDTSLVMWMRDDNENIAISPDGFKGTTVAVEAKCLSSARHMEAWLTQEVPDEYVGQKIQYFLVNEKLKTLYFIFYDPRIPCKDFFFLTFHRKDLQKEIDEYLAYELSVMEEVNTIVNQLTF